MRKRQSFPVTLHCAWSSSPFSFHLSLAGHEQSPELVVDFFMHAYIVAASDCAYSRYNHYNLNGLL